MAEFWAHKVPVPAGTDWKRWGGILAFCDERFPRANRFQTKSWQAFAWTHVAFQNEGDAVFFAMFLKDEGAVQGYQDQYVERADAAVAAIKEREKEAAKAKKKA